MIEVINRALYKIGQPSISSINQEPYGSILGILYNDCKESLLSSYVWRFALKKAILAPDESKPIDSFQYQYTIPTDCLLIHKININSFKTPNLSDLILVPDNKYSFESDKILTDIKDKLHLSYVSNITETRLFSRLFRETLIAYIASEACLRITQNLQLKGYLQKEMEGLINSAVINNDIVVATETVQDNSWVYVRESWGASDDS